MSEASEALGQRLKAERVRKGLSCQKAADELHLDGWVIEGLESGDYARIGPSVYAKGHFKRYAALLGLPVNELLESFEDQPSRDRPGPERPGQERPGQDASASPSSMRMRTAPSAAARAPWGPIGGAALIALVIGGVWFWHPWRPRAPGGPAPAALSAEPAAGSAAPLPITAVPPAAETAAATVPAASEAQSGAGRARLRLLFLGDSWVDVHDASGQRLYAGNGRVNNVRSMTGMGPLRVYIKSASNVHVDLNNHMVIIGPQFIVDNVAHFQAGADGVLRHDAHFTPPGATAPGAARPRG